MKSCYHWSNMSISLDLYLYEIIIVANTHYIKSDTRSGLFAHVSV